MTSAPFARAPATSFCTFGTEAAQRGRRCVLHVWLVKSITSRAVSAGLKVAGFSAGGGGSFALPHSSMTVCPGAFVKQAAAMIAAAMTRRFRSLFICASIEADDLDPVRTFPGRILLQQPERAARLLDRVVRDRFRLFPRGDEEPSPGIDRESARLLLRRRAREIAELPACRIDAERGESVRGALRGVQEFSVRGQVQVSGPDVVVGVARRAAGGADSAAWRAGLEL